MKINAITGINNNYNFGYSKSITKDIDNNKNNDRSSLNGFSYPKNYYISFQAGRSCNDIYNKYKDDMPLTVKTYKDTQELLRTKEELKKLEEGGFIVYHMLAFEKLKDCKTVEDIKRQFPDEPLFKNLKSLDEVINRSDSVFAQLKRLQNQGVRILESEDDVTTFIVKKFFLECRPYKEVFDELYNALTPEAKESECGQMLNNISDARKSNAKLYQSLGIEVPNGREYSASIRFTNPEYSKIKERKYLSNLSADETNEKIKNLLESTEAKARYSMIDAWNHCVEVREELSKYMTECLNNNQYYISQISSLENLTVYDIESYSKLKGIMIAFWNKHPDYKEKLGEEIAKAIARYNQISYLGEEELQKHIEEVKKRSLQIRKTIQLDKKKNQTLRYENAIELLSIAAKKANVFAYGSDSSYQDFRKMLVDSTSQEELIVLEGDKNSEEFKQLVPKGIIAKMQKIVKTPEFANISNAHHLALIQEAVNSGIDKKEIEKIIEKSKISIKNTAREIATGDLSGQIDFNKAETTYNRFKSHLSNRELLQITDELMYNSGLEFNEEEEQCLKDLIKTQGAYLKLILNENQLNNLVKTLILNLYDKIYGTNYTQELVKLEAFDKIILDAINNMDNFDLDNISFTW